MPEKMIRLKSKKLYPHPVSNLLRYKISIIKYSVIYFVTLLAFYLIIQIPLNTGMVDRENGNFRELLLSGFIVSSYFIILALYIYRRIVTKVRKDLETEKIRELERLLHEQKSESRAFHQELQERTLLLEQQKEEIRQKNIELKLAQHEIREKANFLEIASKYKSEFFANMSHEFRTPLNSIIVLSQLIAENRTQNLTEKQKEFARTIYSSGNVLLELINEILEVTRIESGKVELHPEYIVLWEITDQLKMMFQPIAQQKGLEFSIELDENLPDRIFTDSKRLHQILRNLISNAVKFTDQGVIRIHLSRHTHGKLAISVIDTGIGISEDKHSAVFEAFQQADGTTSSKYGGTGLGLTIARSLAHMLGGDVVLSSIPGKGSRFTLIIPEIMSVSTLEEKGLLFSPWKNGNKIRNEIENRVGEIIGESNCPGKDDRDNIRSGDKTVLIVDDDPSFANLLGDFARESGYKVLYANTGNCGIEMANLFRPGVIILDICLPEKNGWEVFEALKLDAYTSQIPVYFVSGAEEANEVTDLGARKFYTKPVSLETLREIFSDMEEITTVPVIRSTTDDQRTADEQEEAEVQTDERYMSERKT